MSLALPFALSTSSPQPVASGSGTGSASPKRPRPNQPGSKRKLDRLDLDEDDDVDESDLVAVPASRRRIDEDYDDEDEGDGEGDGEGDAEGEGDGEGEGVGEGGGEEEGEEGRRGRGKESPARHARRDGRTGAVAGPGQGAVSSAARKAGRAEEIDRKGKKRRAETFLLRDQLDVDQAKRFDTFSTVAINKNAVKKLNREMYDQHCPPQICMVLAGMAKIFVADVVELAKDLQASSLHPTGPLQPYHLKMARMQLEEQGRSTPVNGLRPKKAMFRRR